ncbi:MAG: FKBP-type peptidyl-prolyl cis-trans isomerase [Gammaproteobacteria bacterium]|nr:FKBP-type peptidyl-prolyl cis-trans isomerase [Gammaproteobacteria bacterium]
MKKYILVVVLVVVVVVVLYALTVKRHNVTLQQKQVDQSQTMSAAAQKNTELATEFFAANRQNTGVVTLPNGLQYKVMQKGSGTQPKLHDTVVVDYEGRLLNGEIFDSSYARKQSVSFQLSTVIQGWQQGLQLMRTGGTWMFYIPAKLAYGAQGYPPVIGPNEALIFKVHLLKIKKAV